MAVLTEENREDMREGLIAYYLKKAKPGNWFWRKVEELQGFDGDYIPGQDDGEPPVDYEFLK